MGGRDEPSRPRIGLHCGDQTDRTGRGGCGERIAEERRMTWTAADVPDQTGRVAVITGANTGIGFEAATVLAGKGAQVVMAVRDLDKGRDAASRITVRHPHAHVTVQRLDLSSLTSVRAAADEVKSANPQIDLLINNAGVMFTPEGVTPDGVEFQFGTNHRSA